MNILILTNLFPPEFLGGYEIGCSRIAVALAERGHRVTVLTTGRSSVDPHPNVSVLRSLELTDIYRYDRTVEGDVAAFAFHEKNASVLLTHLQGRMYDLVYAFNLVGLGGLQIVDLLNLSGIPWVWHLMDRVPVELVERTPAALRHLFECSSTRSFAARKHFSMSRTLRTEISSFNIGLAGDVEIVPGWAPEVSSIHLDHETVEGRPIRFVSVGTLSPEKGTDLLIEAAACLMDEDLQFTIDLFGPGNTQKFRRQAATLGVEHIVHVHGPVQPEEMETLWSKYDAIVFPTRQREPFGFVALEAGAHGLAPIITSGAGVTEVLSEGRDYIAVDRSSDSVARAMRLMISDEKRRVSIGRACQAKVRNHFTLDKIAGDIERLLTDAIEPAASGPFPNEAALALIESRAQAMNALLPRSIDVPHGETKLDAARYEQAAKATIRIWRKGGKREKFFRPRNFVQGIVLRALRGPLTNIVSRLLALEDLRRG